MSADPSGVDLIAAERQRQISEEGHTPEHDAGHGNAAMAWAAACYAAPETIYRIRAEAGQVAWWEPWPKWWRRRRGDDRIRELTKAGALIAAEIDRLRGQS